MPKWIVYIGTPIWENWFKDWPCGKDIMPYQGYIGKPYSNVEHDTKSSAEKSIPRITYDNQYWTYYVRKKIIKE
jgi:hypothetical protein